MYELEVAKGAAWLDKVCPGWEWKIDMGSLDVSNGRSCVIGQLGGEAAYAKLAMAGCYDVDGMGFCIPQNVLMGIVFDPLFSQKYTAFYVHLTEAWKQEILRRRALKVMQEEILATVEARVEQTALKEKTDYGQETKEERPRGSDGKVGVEERGSSPVGEHWTLEYGSGPQGEV